MRIIAEIHSVSQLSEGLLSACGGLIFAPYDYGTEIIESFLCACGRLGGNKCGLYIKLPLLADEADAGYADGLLKRFEDGFDGIAGENPYAFMLALKYGKPYFAGAFHNIYNGEIKETFTANNAVARFLLSPELNQRELESLYDERSYVFSYGAVPIMNFKHCPVKNAGGSCGACPGRAEYRDEKYAYTAKRVKVLSCSWVLYNPVTLNLSRFGLKGGVYLHFDTETSGEAEKISKAFKEGLPYSDGKTLYTSGHYRRGLPDYCADGFKTIIKKHVL